MKELLQPEEFKSMMLELDNAITTLDYNLNAIKIGEVLNRMGFPKNWKELMTIERGNKING